MSGALILLILMIPVIAWSPIGRALALRLQNDQRDHEYLAALEQRINQLERFSLQHNQDLGRLQSQLKFHEQLAQKKGPESAELANPATPKPLNELNEPG